MNDSRSRTASSSCTTRSCPASRSSAKRPPSPSTRYAAYARWGPSISLERIAQRCSADVVKVDEVLCCGFAGDKGFNRPELNEHALRHLHEALPVRCSTGYSTSRTCEIGLSEYSGFPYQSIIHLVDECARVTSSDGDATAKAASRPTRSHGFRPMKVALFVPCYIDAFFPEVGVATLELLERLDIEVVYPLDQTCCGAADGQQRLPRRGGGDGRTVRQELRGFRLHRRAFGKLRSPRSRPSDGDPADAAGHEGPPEYLRARRIPARRRQGRRRSHGRRSRTRSACTTAARRCGRCARPRRPRSTSRISPSPWTCCPRSRGSSSSRRERPDECCGFGGTFSVFEEPVSARMGYDKVNDHHRAGAEYIVSADMSCMMHQKGCAERLGLADQVHSHRASAERGPGMKRIDHAEASSNFIKAKDHIEFHDRTAVGPARRSATARASSCPNGRSCARWPRRSRNTR